MSLILIFLSEVVISHFYSTNGDIVSGTDRAPRPAKRADQGYENGKEAHATGRHNPPGAPIQTLEKFPTLVRGDLIGPRRQKTRSQSLESRCLR